ncbi:MAG: hypothetical protein ABII82_01335 [Verrucomicrobiota bacterium]
MPKTAKNIIELDKTLVNAMRMSAALPGTQHHGSGHLHVLYAEDQTPIGYLVEKVAVDDQWEANDPRFFVTTDHAAALGLLGTPYRKLPARAVPVAA